MAVLLWLHLVGAALWLGGLVALAMAVLVALRTLPSEMFRVFVRHAGWAFAGLSALAWLLIAVSGILMAGRLGWPVLVRIKTAVAGSLLAEHSAARRHRPHPGLTAGRGDVQGTGVPHLWRDAGDLLVGRRGCRLTTVGIPARSLACVAGEGARMAGGRGFSPPISADGYLSFGSNADLTSVQTNQVTKTPTVGMSGPGFSAKPYMKGPVECCRDLVLDPSLARPRVEPAS